MDVRHLTFLARQPSARLQDRERFWGLPKRGIALILANALFWQPIWAQADGIAVSGGTNTTLSQAGNGVPVVNIAAPNASGLSHNQYQQYNVGSQGLILNNATGRTQSTQLGGIIVGNPNLHGQAAGTILNEVVGANASQLNGYTEVAGQGARVIVANPYGVSCNGCGFINTPRVTITTGKPVLGGNGQVDHFQVDGGTVSIQGQGLDASQVEQFDIITRAAQINAQINAKQLAIVAGRNNVDAQTNTATALADDGSAKPSLAIDSSALGGMYAGAIKLVGTEAGVGVRLAGNLAASGGDIQIDANGQLNVGQVAASGAVVAKAAEVALQGPMYGQAVDVRAGGDLSIGQSVAARDTVRLAAGGTLSNSGVIEAGVNADNSRNAAGDVVLNAGAASNTGRVIASRQLQATVVNGLDNQGSLSAAGVAQVKAGQLNNRQGRVQAQNLTLNASRLDNQQGVVTAAQNLGATVATLSNEGGEVSSQGVLTLSGNNLDNRNGKLIGDQALTLTSSGTLSNATGTIAGRNLAIDADTFENGNGTVRADGDLTVAANRLTQAAGKVLAQGHLSLVAGQVSSTGGALINGHQGATVNVGTLSNTGSEVSTLGVLTLTASSLDNQNGRLIGDSGLGLDITGNVNNQSGALSSHGAWRAQVGGLFDNRQGNLFSTGAASLTSGSLLNDGGAFIGQNTLHLTTGAFTNGAGQIGSEGDLTLHADTLTQNGGKVIAHGRLDLTAASLGNQDGGLISGRQGVAAQVTTLDNRGGELSSQAALTLTSSRLDNRGGKLIGEAIQTNVTELDNSGNGLVNATGSLRVDGQQLLNVGGALSSGGDLTLALSGAFTNAGQVVTDGGLVVHSAGFDNGGGKLSAKGALKLDTGRFNNGIGGSLISGSTLALTATDFTNAGRLASAGALDATVNSLANQGSIFSQSQVRLDLNHGLLTNTGGGAITTPGALLLNNLGQLRNAGEISSQTSFLVAADSLDNSGGTLVSGQSLQLRVAQALRNILGTIAASTLDVQAGSVANAGGTFNSASDLILRSGQAIDNSDHGVISSQGTLSISASALDNSAGKVSATGNATVDVGVLTQRGGQLITDQALTLNFTPGGSGLLDNRGGLLRTQQALHINGLAELDNREQGEVSSTQSFALGADRVRNTNGKLISHGTLSVNANVDNAAGLLSGWQGVTIAGADLNNQGGTVSSRDGDVAVTLSGALDNRGNGGIGSQGALAVTAASLDNRGGVVSSVGGQQLRISGALLNSGLGLLDAGAALDLNAGSLDNAGGTVQAASTLALAAQQLDNRGGSVLGKGSLTLTLVGDWLNDNGKALSGADLLLAHAGNVSNAGGKIASDSRLTLLATQFDNRNSGNTSATGDLRISTSGALFNGANGVMLSQTGVTVLNAAGIDNSGGTVQGATGVTAEAGGQALINLNGRVIAEGGDLSLSAVGVDNRGGTLASLSGAVIARIAGMLRNGGQGATGGLIQGQRLSVTTSGGIDNYNGRFVARQGEALLTAPTFDNRNGAVSAQGLVTVTGGSFDNSGDADGQVAGGQVEFNLSGALNNQNGIVESGSNLSITAANLDNRTGQLRALGTGGVTRLNLSGALDNRNGTLETANNDLLFNIGSFSNSGGSVRHIGTGAFGLGLAVLQGAGGSLNSNGSLLVQGDSWTNSSVLQVQDLTVNVGQFTQTASGQLIAGQRFSGNGADWHNDGLIATNGDLALTLSGRYDGSGQATSLGALTLQANSLSLDGASARLAAGGSGLVQVAGTLVNRGRLTANAGLTLSANTLNNYGTLGGAGNVSLSSNSLLNEGGLLFSGGTFKVNANDLTNHYGDIYSLGDLAIEGRSLGSRANSFSNRSGSVESNGNLTLNAEAVLNTRDVFEMTAALVSADFTMRCMQHCGGNDSWKRGEFFVSRTVEGQVLQDSPMGRLVSGGDLIVTGNTITNQYSLMSASRELAFTATNITNQGATAVSGTSRIQISEGVKIPVSTYDARQRDVDAYHASYTGTFDPAAYETLLSKFDRSLWPAIDTPVAVSGNGSSVAPAIIQAGGDARLTASNDISNIVVSRTPSQSAAALVETSVAPTALNTTVTLNRQLPPNLAQQQVNPTTLPGFSLPTGQNGLFHLSTQDGSAATTSAAGIPALTQASLGTLSNSLGNDASQASVVPAGVVSSATINVPGAPQASVVAAPTGVASITNASYPAVPHRYLVETNPALTDLKQFMSSDYLLGQLNYNPDNTWKRLGDGLYEQRLVEQAVVARTGQRYIDGMASDEGQFKYLMDNAIASKNALNLTVGVGLSSEQVAALTHDIVWMEDQQVNGEHVLVPVLYLAQANNRLAATGALIQGGDVTLIAGQNLNNVGTLKATANLTAIATNNLVNSGLAQAGDRATFTAGNDLTNRAGGLIAARDVAMTAVSGDLLNERSVTTSTFNGQAGARRTDFADSAARVEAANDLILNAGRDLTNQGGVLQAGRDLNLSAGRDALLSAATMENFETHGAGSAWSSVTQLGSTTSAGGNLAISAGRDLTAVASTLKAGGDVALRVANGLTLASAADESHRYLKTRHRTEQEDHVSQVATTVTAGGAVAVSAGQDVTLVASKVDAGKEAYVYAGNNIDLLAAQNEDYSFYQKTKKHSGAFSSSSKTTVREGSASEAIGSTIKAGEVVTLGAIQDINAVGATVTSTDAALKVTVGRDINIAAAQSTYSQQKGESKTKHGLLSGSEKIKLDAQRQTVAESSTFSGDTTSITAGRDLIVDGSNIVSTQQTTLAAAGNVLIDTAQQTQDSQHKESVKRSGLMSNGGIGITLGSSLNKTTQTATGESQKASTVGSVLGNVNVIAGKDVTVRGSELVAGNDISLTGRNVNVIAAPSQSTFEQTQQSRSGGLTLALSGPVGSAVNTAAQDLNEARKSDSGDSRLNAIQGVKAGLSSYQAWQAAQLASGSSPTGDAGSFWGISLSLGSQHSQSKQTQTQNINQGTTLTAGRDISVTATGKQGDGGDIVMQGAQAKGGRDLLLNANRDILLAASSDTQTVRGNNTSGGGNVGLSLGGGSNGAGLSIFANGNAGKGFEKGNGVNWNETTLDAGRQASLHSGRDTTLEGAQVSADQVVANAGRDLLLRSPQDANNYASLQQNVSGGLSFTLGSMTLSGYLSLTQDRLKSNFDSVHEQTGLFAGKGGYQVSVGNHTQLDGAVIGSTASSDKNSLTTGTLGWTNLRNQAEFSAEHQGVSVSSSGAVGSQFLGNMANGLLAGANRSGHDSSTTYAAVSPGALLLTNPAQQAQNVAALDRDVAHAANALSPIFDKEKEQKRLQQAQMIAELGSQAMDVIRTQGEIEAAKAKKDPAALDTARLALIKDGNNSPTDKEIADKAGSTAMQKYGTGSSLQRAAQAVTAAVQGLAGGNLQAAISGAAAPYLANTIKQLAGDNDEARIMAQAVLGAVVAKAQGSSTGAGAAGAAVGELVAAALYPNTKTENMTEEQRQTVSALSTLAAGLAGGLVGGDAASGIAGAQAGQTAVENNYLSPEQIKAWTAEVSGCEARGDCGATIKKYEELSDAQQQQLMSDCAASPDTCQAKYGSVLAESLEVRKAIDAALKEDIPAKMTYDLTALVMHQVDVDGVVSSAHVSEVLMSKYGLSNTEAVVAAGIIATAVMATVGVAARGKLSNGAKGAGEIAGSAKNFSIADRVFGQLNDPRMGQLAGKLDADALQKLANNPSATRFMDARTGHINVIQEVEGKLIRITVPRDEMKIISVGPIRPNQVKNLLGKGDFVPLP